VDHIKARIIFLAVMIALSVQALLVAFSAIPSFGFFDGDH
jgi:hypothetical protein